MKISFFSLLLLLLFVIPVVGQDLDPGMTTKQTQYTSAINTEIRSIKCNWKITGITNSNKSNKLKKEIFTI